MFSRAATPQKYPNAASENGDISSWDPWSNDKMQLKQLTKTLPKLNLADELTNVHNPGGEKNTSKLCWGAYGAYA